jgi:hypothetical protein
VERGAASAGGDTETERRRKKSKQETERATEPGGFVGRKRGKDLVCSGDRHKFKACIYAWLTECRVCVYMRVRIRACAFYVHANKGSGVR